jgi:hypothetical protein
MAEEDKWVTRISTRTSTRRVDRSKAEQGKAVRSSLLDRAAATNTVARNQTDRAKVVLKEASKVATAEVLYCGNY